MSLTSKQKSILKALSAEWQTPIQIADRLPKEWGNLSDLNQDLKLLIREGLVQVNPVVFGLHRLTEEGKAIKVLEFGEN